MTHEAALDAALTAFWKRPPPLHDDDTAEIAAAIQAYLSASGMVLVPRKPTQEMTEAWGADFDLWFNEKIEPEWHMWNIMLDSAPDPFKCKP